MQKRLLFRKCAKNYLIAIQKAIPHLKKLGKLTCCSDWGIQGLKVHIEWVPSSKRNPHIKTKALVLLVLVEISKKSARQDLNLLPQRDRPLWLSEGMRKGIKIWKQTFELQKGRKSMEAFENGPSFDCVCVCMRVIKNACYIQDQQYIIAPYSCLWNNIQTRCGYIKREVYWHHTVCVCVCVCIL